MQLVQQFARPKDYPYAKIQQQKRRAERAQKSLVNAVVVGGSSETLQPEQVVSLSLQVPRVA